MTLTNAGSMNVMSNLELIELFDFESEAKCYHTYPEPCGLGAEWFIEMSCGCSTLKCESHYQWVLENSGRFGCITHGLLFGGVEVVDTRKI